MDELWQKYRSFWVPVLYGIGAFLAGLMVVHIVSDDPEVGRSQNEAKAASIKNRVAPSEAQIRGLKGNVETLSARVDRWAARLDQRHGDAQDEVEAFTIQAYRAAFLRGSSPVDEARFDGDKSAAAAAAATYERLLQDRLGLLRTQDPNVSFSRVKADVVQELTTRANRADVDLGTGAEEMGMTAVQSVERADLPRRLANLALVATMADVAIREGVRSIDAVTILPPEAHMVPLAPDSFVSEWPVTFVATGTPAALSAILNVLTDPERPTPLGTSSWKQTPKKDGFVRAEFKAYSVRVRPEAVLGLENERGV